GHRPAPASVRPRRRRRDGPPAPASRRRSAPKWRDSDKAASDEPQREPPEQEHDDAQDHGKGVLIDESGLDLPQHARGRGNEPPAAVDEEAVDDRPITNVRKQGADTAKPAGEE